METRRAARRWSKRFNVSGYPTMLLLTADGNEVTRLEGSVEPAKYMQLLEYGLAGGASARQLLDTALAGKPLSAENWRLLAYYSWGTDDEQLVPEKDVPATLLKLARSCPPAQREASSRLVLQALGAVATAKDEAKPSIDKADALASVKSVLARPELVREHYDQLAFNGDDIVGAITAPKSAERAELINTWSDALDRSADQTLSQAGRIWATSGKVALARLDNKDGALPAPLLEEVRAQAARADRETTDSTSGNRSSTAPVRCSRARAARRVRRVDHPRAEALTLAVLLHAGARIEREEAQYAGGQYRSHRLGAAGV